ncbi:hypothetical protein BBAD15_g7374 [Beauveria bassiana D1-5]|uniref:Uncharacterized protein n=1 Tax=Beauveria bassiana D1-5 TaxID=1245745 RepID=A0A0A2VMF7_BEABA|nr:hypothetical protein BBAD15_g7374 [Beauveria bassiana D1-5]
MHGGIPRRQHYLGPIYERTLRPPGAHPIADSWNDPEGPLRVSLLHALQGFPWTAIDWFRVGVERPYSAHSTFELTLLVSVRPNLVSLVDASEAVHQCKAIIESYGFMDIHCEIRESSVSLLVDDTTTSEPTTQGMDMIHKVPADGRFDMYDFNSMIGTEIAMLKRPDVTATKGLYIQGKYLGQQYTAALTCRHLLTVNTDDNIDLEPMKPGQTVGDMDLSVIQWGDDKPQNRLLELQELLDDLARDRRPVWELKPAKVEADRKLRKAYEDMAAPIARLYNARDRVFGKVLLSPSISLKPQGSGVTNQWFMDWMLIQLDASRHEEELSQLDNTLTLSQGEINAAAKAVGTNKFSDLLKKQMYQDQQHGDTISFPLRGFMSVNDMRYPKGHTKYEDERATRVGKFGAKSHLTFGYASTFKSVVRTSFDNFTMPSEVWPVITSRKSEFSQSGDSGSCVWALDGRIAGIVVAGIGKLDPKNEAYADITYVMPIEVYLEDMKRWGFEGVV